MITVQYFLKIFWSWELKKRQEVSSDVNYSHWNPIFRKRHVPLANILFCLLVKSSWNEWVLWFFSKADGFSEVLLADLCFAALGMTFFPVCPDRVGHSALPVWIVGNPVSAAEAGGGGAFASASCRPVLPRVCGLHLAVVRFCLLTYAMQPLSFKEPFGAVSCRLKPRESCKGLLHIWKNSPCFCGH